MSRTGKLQALLPEQGIEGLLVTNPQNRRYLSGFTGSAGVLLVTAHEAWLITDFRYVEQAKVQAPGFRVIRYEGSLAETVAQIAREAGIQTLGFEKNHLTVAQWEEYREKLGSLTFLPTGELVEGLRAVKEPEEIALIAQAQELADEAFSHILQFLRPGIRERDVAVELECFMKKRGAEDRAFDFIVASGIRSALPHGTATNKELAVGDLVTLDFGAVCQGYHSDLTRTVILGEAQSQQEEIYRIVLEAQEAALAALWPGMEVRELDRVAREVIAGYGYGDNFGHGLGHGVGLAVHENPSVSFRGTGVLNPGMVITIEPGLYLPGWGGVRIEDLVVVTGDGYKNLTRSPKELLVI